MTRLDFQALKEQGVFEIEVLNSTLVSWYEKEILDEKLGLHKVNFYFNSSSLADFHIEDIRDDIIIVNLNGLNPWPLSRYFLPYLITCIHKSLDNLIEFILSANNVERWRFRDKIQKYEDLMRSSNSDLPTFLLKNPEVHMSFFKIYQFLTTVRNGLAHGSNFEVLDNKLNFSTRNGNSLSISMEEIEQLASFIVNLYNCLLTDGYSYDFEKYFRYLSQSAKKLSGKYHNQTILGREHLKWFNFYIKVNPDDFKKNGQSFFPFPIDIDSFKHVAINYINDKYPEEKNSFEEVFNIFLNVSDGFIDKRYKIPRKFIDKGGSLSILEEWLEAG